ncbi:DNA-directed DNA polymerase [Trema orientale]|uniref:DNA-directed DNA polymerase n=1 Tax=Trema orientale TaxID=63057 RepID=A0A2P5FCA0_TREOI|nr:DNA-directed DNA polymerase [Trema orientale]
MQPNAMEPKHEIKTYVSNRLKNWDNFTTVCTALERMHAQGSFLQQNPLSFAFPLLLMQLSLASGAALLTSLLLKPLQQSLIVAQTLGGLILGPSGLGRIDVFTINFFPVRSFVLLDILSWFGFMLCFFLIGVQTDPFILKKINKNTLMIGIITVVVPMVLSEAFAYTLAYFIDMDSQLMRSLPMVAQAESMLALPTVSYLLGEFNIMNSEFGRVAMCSSTVSGLFSLCATATMVLAGQSANGNAKTIVTNISSVIVLTAIIVFVIRPAILWMIQKNPVEAPVSRNHFIALLTMVLVTAFCSQAAGLNIYFGPLILGIAIPAGPPIGPALKEKLHLITDWIFLPLFFVKNGCNIDVFHMQLKNYIIVQLVALVAALGKFIGAFVTSRCRCNMPTAHAIALGLVMNAQGLLELGLFKQMKREKVIDYPTFASMCVSMLIITGSVTPVIKRLYDPSQKYTFYRRRSVMHAKPQSQRRLLVCLHDEEIAPTIINILEALNPRRESPLFVFVLHLVELVGRARPLLIPHKLTNRPSSRFGRSKGVIEAFRDYEQKNLELVSVYPYTAICPCATMHDEVCTLALDRKTSLIIIPFYNKLHADGTIESSQKAAQIMNKNVLDKVPCSVAILVDRGLLKSPWPVLGTLSTYRVGVVFLGGADDREALTIGAIMANHPKITLTMIRLVVDGNVTGNDKEERRVDNEFLSDFRQAMVANNRVTYIEEIVTDGIGTAAVICSMTNNYELVLAGRSHDTQSPLLSGLADGSERAELGAIGEILASADFKGNTTILVVQQHALVVNERNESHKHSLGAPQPIKNDEGHSLGDSHSIKYDKEQMQIQEKSA